MLTFDRVHTLPVDQNFMTFFYFFHNILGPDQPLEMPKVMERPDEIRKLKKEHLNSQTIKYDF